MSEFRAVFGFCRLAFADFNVILVYRSRFGISHVFFKGKFGGQIVCVGILCVVRTEFGFRFGKFSRSVGCGVSNLFDSTVAESQLRVVNFFGRTGSGFGKLKVSLGVIVVNLHYKSFAQTELVGKQLRVYLNAQISRFQSVFIAAYYFYDFCGSIVEFEYLYPFNSDRIPYESVEIYGLDFRNVYGIFKFNRKRSVFQVSAAVQNTCVVPGGYTRPVGISKAPFIARSRMQFVNYDGLRFFLRGDHIAEYKMRTLLDIKNLKFKTFD